MYHGEVNVAQEDLNSFLAVAEDLKVKGLTQNQTQTTENSNRNIGSKSSLKPTLPCSPERVSLPKPSKDNTSTAQGFAKPLREIQEVSIKSEPRDPPISYPNPPLPQLPPEPAVEEAAHEENILATYHDDTTYEDYEQYGDDHHYEEANTVMDQADIQQQVHGKGHDRSILLRYILKESSGLFQCTLCGKTNAQKNNIMNHVEGIHFPDSFIYQCQICSKTMKTKNALYLHTNTFHKDKS